MVISRTVSKSQEQNIYHVHKPSSCLLFIALENIRLHTFGLHCLKLQVIHCSNELVTPKTRLEL